MPNQKLIYGFRLFSLPPTPKPRSGAPGSYEISFPLMLVEIARKQPGNGYSVPGIQTDYLGAQKGATVAFLISTVSQTLPLT